MNVRNIRRVLRQKNSLSLRELAFLADVSADDLLPVMREWVSAGRVEEIEEIPVCGGSCSCSGRAQQFCSAPGDILRYRWIQNNTEIQRNQ
ncbi:MAG: FeoC-like transcriptional regulator [Fibrobacterota bacterium]